MNGSLHASAAGELLDSLSFSRTRKFSSRVEDELDHLLRSFMRSRGAQKRMVFPPLSQPLRETLSFLADRYGMRVMVMPEGDLEKPTSVEVCQTSRFPCLKIQDLAPRCCALQYLHRKDSSETSDRTMTSIGTEAMSNENESQRQIESSRTPDAREVDNSVGKRDRPAMAIYRPRQARVGGESSQKNEHDDQHKTDDQVGQVSRPSERIPEEDKALQETIFEMASNPDETSQQTDCSLLYDYESFRMDLTSSRVWEDQPKKKTYLELKPSSNSRCHWDPTWQLRAPDNGFFSFTAQPSEAHDARIVVHLSTQKGQLTTFYEVEVDTVKHSCKIRHVSNENLIETCENGPSNLQQASSSCRPPPQSFWIAYRHGTIAVGKGTRLVDSTILCNMRASVIERGIQAIGFSVPSDAKNISLSRIFFGKKLCRNVASLSHIRLIKANDSIFEEVINRKRTRNHFENLPSVITWNSNVGSRMFENELLRHIQEVVGCDNVAFRCKFPSWGWAIFSSCGAADKLQADLLGMREKGKFAQVQVMRCEEATREELLASGLPVTRDRPKATARVANRLISSALKGVMSGNNRRR